MLDVLAVVEREDHASQRLVDVLESAGIRVRTEHGRTGIEHTARALRPGAVLFAALGEAPEFIDRLRRVNPAHVLIAWTSTASSATTADLLESGADEVVHAVMTDREVVARVSNALRRGGTRAAAAVDLGALRVDPLHGESLWDGHDLSLSRREREVLEILAENAGRTVRREILYRRVWGYDMPRGERSVDVNVKRLRRKLAAKAGPDLQIKTQPGVGYRLELATERAAEPVTTL